MALDPSYITSAELQSYFVDKDSGLPLAGGLIYFWEDLNRNQLKPVYQLSGSPPNYTYTALPNPLTLSGVGTFMDNNGNDIAVYYRPFDDFGNVQNYFIQVYAAGDPPPGGVPQFTREAWPNEISDNSNPGAQQSGFENELSNPQFAEVLFLPDDALNIAYVGSGTEEIDIAPGWTLEIIHIEAGVVSVSRNRIAGSQVVPTNPPYSLTVVAGQNLAGLILRQRLSGNPGIWSATNANNGYVASSITLAPNTGTISMNYTPSSTGTEQVLLVGTNAGGGSWKTINSTIQLDPSNNPSVGGIGFVDITIDLPVSVNSVSTITSVQVVGVDTNIQNVGFDQEPINRQIDHLFHYYNPQLRYKQIPSYLVGWDFPLNPAQFPIADPTFAIGANKAQYVWDQTIVYQSADQSVGVSRAPSGALRLTALDTTPISIIQYLDQKEARKILKDRFALNIAAKGSQVLGTQCNVSFYYTTDVNLPDVSNGTNNSLIATVDGNGKPATFNGTWDEVTRSELQDVNFFITARADTKFNDYNYAGWDLDGDADADLATFFAIVISFVPAVIGDTVDILSVGLCAGDIATRPAPLTVDEALRQCEQYFETSYDTNIDAIGAVGVPSNALTAPQLSSTVNANVYTYRRNNFGFQYRAQKRTDVPVVHLYSPSGGTIDRVDLTMRNADGSSIIVPNPTLVNTNNWLQTGLGSKSTFYSQTGAGTALSLNYAGATDMPSVWINYHYVVDARLGIVN